MHHNRHHFRPCALGTHTGRPAVQWSRAGHAMRGEPSTVYATTTHATEAEALAVILDPDAHAPE